MSYLAVGVIGHVDHGKTALVRVLTGVDTDRLKEEKARGISIALGFAETDLPCGRVAFVDAPGHERFVRTMIAGATGIGAVLLAVDVNEGVKPQTIEHLDIAGLLGIRRGVVVISKCDTADDEARALARADVESLLDGSFLADAPVVFTSADTGEGLDALRAALDTLLRAVELLPDEGYAYLPIDRVFTMSGFGTVVTGTLRRGSLGTGETLAVYPAGLRAEVRQVQTHGAPVERAYPGQRTAVNLRGVAKDQLHRGDALAHPESVWREPFLDIELRLLPSAGTPLRHRQVVRVLFGTTEAFGRMHLLYRDALEPGGRCVAQVQLDAPAAYVMREPFIVRSYSPIRTLGGGRLLGGTSSRRKRREESVAALETLARGDVSQVLELDARSAEPAPLDLDRFAVLRRIPAEAVQAAADNPSYIRIGEHCAVRAAFLEENSDRVVSAIRAFHAEQPVSAGIAFDTLRDRLEPVPHPDVLAAALDRLVEAGRLVQQRGAYRLPEHAAGDGLSDADRALRGEIETAFRDGRFEPPDLRRVVGRNRERQRMYRHLVDTGVLVPTHVANKPRTLANTIVFHCDTIAEAQALLAEHFQESGRFDTAAAKAALGISRKYLIPLLECLDAHGFSKRVANERVLVAK